MMKGLELFRNARRSESRRTEPMWIAIVGYSDVTDLYMIMLGEYVALRLTGAYDNQAEGLSAFAKFHGARLLELSRRQLLPLRRNSH